MAERIDKPDARAKESDDEVRIIAPERSAVIAGRTITMREPSWLEGLELDPGLQPVIAEIEQAIGDRSQPDFGEMQRILYRHREIIVTMMGICAGVEAEWIVALSDRDGQQLAALFWAVNAPFFGRRIRLRAAAAEAVARAGRTLSMH